MSDNSQSDRIGREVETLADRVYLHLMTRIAAGEFNEDLRLPSEHELARLADVSRPVVRDALGRLRAEGVIYSKRGAGSFLRPRAAPQVNQVGFSPLSSVADIQRCYEFRINLEPFAAGLAAARRNDEALAKIERALNALGEDDAQDRHANGADFDFHFSISEASNNHYCIETMRGLKNHIGIGMNLHGLRLRRVFSEHKTIVEMIRLGKPADAEEAMREHLVGSRDRLFEGKTLDLALTN